MNGSSTLRMATKKAGPVVTDQGNLILDVLFYDGIKNPKDIEMSINNIPGVLENGLFVDLTDKVLVGKIEKNDGLKNNIATDLFLSNGWYGSFFNFFAKLRIS